MMVAGMGVQPYRDGCTRTVDECLGHRCEPALGVRERITHNCATINQACAHYCAQSKHLTCMRKPLPPRAVAVEARVVPL